MGKLRRPKCQFPLFVLGKIVWPRIIPRQEKKNSSIDPYSQRGQPTKEYPDRPRLGCHAERERFVREISPTHTQLPRLNVAEAHQIRKVDRERVGKNQTQKLRLLPPAVKIVEGEEHEVERRENEHDLLHMDYLQINLYHLNKQLVNIEKPRQISDI